MLLLFFFSRAYETVILGPPAILYPLNYVIALILASSSRIQRQLYMDDVNMPAVTKRPKNQTRNKHLPSILNRHQISIKLCPIRVTIPDHWQIVPSQHLFEFGSLSSVVSVNRQQRFLPLLLQGSNDQACQKPNIDPYILGSCRRRSPSRMTPYHGFAGSSAYFCVPGSEYFRTTQRLSFINCGAGP
ncbi:hypothetical protein BDQ12DRAFT_351825 [Crucibulum laeve]|uniref:Uncharacterized protein n=1 Tax=Crucibulum laeve TaxID=68775 RepID=A0A5C3MCA7_9AGAR|nr:hypothetical protein BDQ12DRAFT_351825 [Crucibulum laeve]